MARHINNILIYHFHFFLFLYFYFIFIIIIKAIIGLLKLTKICWKNYVQATEF